MSCRWHYVREKACRCQQTSRSSSIHCATFSTYLPFPRRPPFPVLAQSLSKLGRRGRAHTTRYETSESDIKRCLNERATRIWQDAGALMKSACTTQNGEIVSSRTGSAGSRGASGSKEDNRNGMIKKGGKKREFKFQKSHAFLDDKPTI